LYLIKAYIIFVIAIQIVYALCGFRDFSEINFFSQSGAPWYLFAMIVWYLTIPVIRKYKEIPVLIVTVALALIAGYFKNIGDFLCMSRILVFGPFFYLGYYMEQPVLERAFGSKLKDELGMVYENISYYELDDVWEGPFVRLALMIAAFLISWAIMFFVPRGKTCLSVIGQNTMPVYMLHRILRDILMFAGIYDYLGDWGWFALFVLICLSICVIYLLVNPKVVNQVNKILTLYTPRLWGRIRRNQAI